MKGAVNMFLSPVKFAEKSKIPYEVVRKLCKEGKFKCEVTKGGHLKIYESELTKILPNHGDFISKEDYEKVIRENERLKIQLLKIKNFVMKCESWEEK